MKTVKFYTVGCKVNQYETQSIRERFLDAGFQELEDGQPADTYLINTCTVTHKADRDSRHFILKARRQNPKARIIVTGCLVEQEALALPQIKGADLVIRKKFFPEGISSFSGHTRAFLKIQDGCDNFCSYCKVPLVRGRSCSRDFSEIIQEARALVENNFKEIVLCGICLGAYGKDLAARLSLVDIIEELEKIRGLLRIRLSSIEAGDVTEELIAQMANSEKLCRHLHIPIQSGNNLILKRMNRRYSSQDYLRLIQRIKKRIPEIAITTDVLVGFPGETEENFKNTCALIKEILPLGAHIFSYSPRPATPAANFQGKIVAVTIKERRQRLEKIAQECSIKYRQQFLNQEMLVLFEAPAKENPGCWEGYTDNYLKVLVKSRQDLQNQLIAVRLKRIVKECLFAVFC